VITKMTGAYENRCGDYEDDGRDCEDDCGVGDDAV
jgi:hypothetical protein